MRRWFSLSALVVLTYATLLGYFSWKTFFSYVEPDYRPLLQWEAPWISHARSDLNQSYFRKKLSVRSKPTHAWIAVMAPDAFDLFVNGEQVGKVYYLSGYAQRVFDIAPYLVVGTNVVAIHNQVGTFPQRTGVVVQGQYLESSGASTDFRSDASWRVAWRDEGFNSQGGIVEATPWFAPQYDDGQWTDAVEREVPRERMTQPLPFSPLVITRPVQADWIWAASSRATEAYFRYVLNLSERPRDAWLRIAARRHYRLLLNGYPLAIEEQTIASETAADNTLRFYNIAPLLGPGHNVIAVQASNERADRGLLVDGYVESWDRSQSWFASAGWKVSEAAHESWEMPAFDDSRWRSAAIVNPISPADQSVMVKEPGLIRLPPSYLLNTVVGAGLILAASLLGCLVLWVGSARVLAALAGVAPHTVGSWLALAFLLPAVLFGALYLLGFDARLSRSFPYQPLFVVGNIAILLFLQAMLIGAAALSRTGLVSGFPKPGTGRQEQVPRLTAIHPGLLLAIGLAILGFGLRLKDVNREALIGDEAVNLQWTLGIFARGYPSMVIDERVKTAFTSELVYYFKALGVWLAGPNALGLRLSEVVFGSLTILLFYWVGKLLHGRRVGLLAGALYTILPSAIGMTHYGRYLSEVQFFALLTFGLLFRAITQKGVRPRQFYLATAAVLATYLSWEGSIFYLPALAFGLMALTRPNFGWMKSGHVWAGLGIVAGVVIVQLSLRFIEKAEWSYYGTSLQDVAPALIGLFPFYDPTYYVSNVFLLEHHFPLTLLFVLGSPLWFCRSREGRILGFMAATLISDLAMMTNLLELSRWRYAYYLLPLLVLSASMVLVIFADFLTAVCRSANAPGLLTRVIRPGTAALLVATVLMFSTSFVVKLYNLPWAYSDQYTRLGVRYAPTMDGAAEYIRQHVRPGDVVVAANPHVVQYYLGHADYFFERRLAQPLLLGSDSILPIHRYAGVPTLLGVQELTEGYVWSSRLWYITFWSHRLPSEWRENARVMYEDWRSTVLLFGSGH